MARPGLLALPAAAVAALLAIGASPAGGEAGDGRVELEVAGVLPIPGEPMSILVLREKGAKRTLLPLFVPSGGEAASREDPRHGGLAASSITALGGTVAEVRIERAEERPAAARVRLSQGARQVEVRGRPSESVALALAAGAPIVTSRRVLDEDGVTEEELVKAHARSRAHERRL